MVYSREIEGERIEFGTSGFTMDNVFVLYDRQSESVWYPLTDATMDAVSGTRKGTSIPFLAEPNPVPLSDWLKNHPNTKVLLPTPFSRTVHYVAKMKRVQEKDSPKSAP